MNRMIKNITERFRRSAIMLETTLEGYYHFRGFRKDKTIRDMYANLWQLENDLKDYQKRKAEILNEISRFESLIQEDYQKQKDRVSIFEGKALMNKLFEAKDDI